MEGVTGFGIFIGIVTGVIVQVTANWFLMRWQRDNAADVLKCEVELNLAEIGSLRDRVKALREKIAAGQVHPSDLFIQMMRFDYSTVPPLVASGHFHKMLGTPGVKSYISASQFFNVNQAAVLTNMLQSEHDKGTSLAFLDWLGRRIDEEEAQLKVVDGLLKKRTRLSASVG